MNVDILIQWGQNMVTFLEKQRKEASDEFDQKQVKKKLGWINGFREQIEEWGQLLQIITTTESFVKRHGLYRVSYRKLKKILAPLANTMRTKNVSKQLLVFCCRRIV